MYRVNVYNYVLDSLNNILDNGLDYYKDKNEELYNRLEQISNYVKDNYLATENNIVEETNKVLYYDIPDSVYDILRKFMNKIAQINIDVLKIESNKSIYYEENTYVKSKEPLIEIEEEFTEQSKCCSTDEVDIIDEISTVEDTDINEDEEEEQDAPPKKSILNIFKW